MNLPINPVDDISLITAFEIHTKIREADDIAAGNYN